MVSEALIKKYFSDDCSEEEKRQIFLYFKENPSEFLDQFSEMDFLATTLPESTGKSPLPGRELRWTGSRRSQFRKLLKAASIIILLLMVGILYQKSRLADSSANKPNAIASQPSTASSPAYMAINNGSNTVELELPDHSSVTLYPGSKINYIAFNQPQKRNVLLEGTAVFNVAHNSSKPFTVYCKEVATTAIGTSFKITTNKGKVAVRLLEGKIKVCEIVDKIVPSKSYYLLAGNSISYDRQLKQFTEIDDHIIKSKKSQVKTSQADMKVATTEPLTRAGTATALGMRFEGTSLSSVLDYLANYYQVKISYPTKVANRIRFVGTVKKEESIQSVLSNLALMNNLILVHDTAGKNFTFKVNTDINNP